MSVILRYESLKIASSTINGFNKDNLLIHFIKKFTIQEIDSILWCSLSENEGRDRLEEQKNKDSFLVYPIKLNYLFRLRNFLVLK